MKEKTTINPYYLNSSEGSDSFKTMNPYYLNSSEESDSFESSYSGDDYKTYLVQKISKKLDECENFLLKLDDNLSALVKKYLDKT